MGDVESETDARGTETTYTYDAYHRVIGKSTPFTRYDLQGDGTVAAANPFAVWTYAYDALGKPALTTDPNGHTTAVELDGLGRERRRLRATAEAIPDSVAGTVHTVSGVLLSQIGYDLAGRKVSEIDGRGIESRAAFDVLDRPILTERRDRRTHRGQIYASNAPGSDLRF